MNGIKDILKDSIEQMGLVEELSLPYIFCVIGIALCCSLVVYIVYRNFYRGAVYSENYGLLIVMATLTTAFIIMTISSNIVLSLGMVGALSIVRFRAAVKDPLDVGFLFIGISAGITAGAGLFFAAVIGTCAICIIYIAMTWLGHGSMTYLLIITYDNTSEQAVSDLLGDVKKKLKSKTRSQVKVEATYAVKIKRNQDITDRLLAEKGVERAILMAYTGDTQY